MPARKRHLRDWRLEGGLRAVASFGLLSVFLLVPANVEANGLAAIYKGDGRWHLLPEQLQQAVVLLENDRQLLILRVALGHEVMEEEARSLVWITPLPARPNDITVDVLDWYPVVEAESVADLAILNARIGLTFMLGSQLVPMGLAMLVPIALYQSADSLSGTGVTTYEQLIRHGVALEVLTAESTSGLVAHLEERGAGLPEDGLAGLEPYLDDYSLIVYRIDDLEAFRAAGRTKRQATELGVVAEFPTEKGYYPLMASSVLPGALMRIEVATIGFSRPRSAPRMLETTHLSGYLAAVPRHAYDPIAERLAPYTRRNKDAPGVGSRRSLGFTRMTLSVSPEALTEDLWFRSGPSLGLRLVHLSNQQRHLIPLLLFFIVWSSLAAVLARWAWPAANRPSRDWAAALGVTNVLTVGGLYVAYCVYARRNGIKVWRALLAGLATSAVFTLGLLVLVLGLMVVEGTLWVGWQ